MLCVLTLLTSFPAASADGRNFKVDTTVTLTDRGHTIVTWDDSDGLGPYKVCYEYANNKKQHTWVADTNLTMKYCEIPDMIPGKAYWIYVYDRNGDVASAKVTVPSRGRITTTRGRKIDFHPMYSLHGNAPKEFKTMSSSSMTRNMRNGYRYGLYFGITYLTPGQKEIVRDAIFAFYSPTGYVRTEYSSNFTLPKGANWTYYYNFVGDSFFDNLLDIEGKITAGEYTFQIYLDGSYFYGTTFSVGK